LCPATDKKYFEMRPRFSLRWILIFTGLVAALCYWWIARPTIVANRFIAAVNRRDFASAHALYVTPITSKNDRHNLARYEFPTVILVGLQRRSWSDLTRGQRRMFVIIGSYDLMWIARGNGVVTR
jgi:hypothetical protein